MMQPPLDDKEPAPGLDAVARGTGLTRSAGALRRKARALMASTRFRLGQPMLPDPTSQVWWVTLLRAAAALVFGVMTLFWPAHSARAIMVLLGTYAIFDGLALSLVAANARRRVWLTIGALVNVIVGLALLTEPRIVALLLMRVLGGWLILRGLAEILGEQRGSKRRDPSVLLNGTMSALFGVALVAAPRVGALGLMWAIGAWAMLHGLLMLPLALRLRREHRF